MKWRKTTHKERFYTLIFVIAWLGVMAWAMLNVLISISGMNYLEQDIDHNYIVWQGTVYGIGLGSLSFCSRCMGAGVAGFLMAISSLWIFPTWLKVRKTEKDEEA